METASRFNDKRYKNWILGTLALQHWKEGLQSFLDDQTDLLHEGIKKNVSSALPGCTCGARCSSSQRMKRCMKCSACSNGCDATEIKQVGRNRSWFMACSICDAWLQNIITYYRGNYRNLGKWNCDPQLWPTRPWEVVKIFMSFGCKSDKSANDADAQAALSLFKNCRHFWDLLKKSHLVKEMFDIRNALFHSSSMCVEDVDLQNYYLNMVDFLQNVTGLSPTQTQQTTEAIRKIQELQTNVLDLSLNKELELKALQQRQIALEQDLKKEQHNYSIKLDAIDPELKALQQKQESLEQELKQTRGALQKEQDSSSKKLSTIDPELTALKKKQIALEQDLKTTKDTLQRELDSHSKRLGTIDPELKSLAESMNKLKESSEKFEEFLEKNDLLQDLTRISSKLEDHDQRIFVLEEQMKMKDPERRKTEAEIRADTAEEKMKDPKRRKTEAEIRADTAEEKMKDPKRRKTEAEIRADTAEEKSKEVAIATRQGPSCSLEKQRKVSGLQQHLIDLYEIKCCWENPLTSDQECSSEMYVSPAIKSMREKNKHGRLTDVKELPSHLTYQHIFSSPSGKFTNIYITGDAGTGKTSFCNKMVRTWCKAMQNVQDETVSHDDLNLLSTFNFLFYINLRNNETIYHVEEMIDKQLLCDAPKPINISNLLKTEKCLIVLDGLDEWSCPDGATKCPDVNENIPGRQRVNKTCVFLTTTRNWKYEVSDLKSKDVDKYVELGGFNDNSSKELAQKMFDYLDRTTPREADFDDFDDEMEKKGLTELINVPVLLIQLITLWHYGKDFGNSQIQLYSSMLDLLFERSEKNLRDKQTEESKHTTAGQSNTLPHCFSNKRFCQSRSELLTCLAKLAYKSLFNKQKEESLVFKSSTLEIFGISQSDITLCLQCGLLSQSKDFGNNAGKYKKFSFLHKKMQEFLVALHIVTFDPIEDILTSLREFCNTLGTMLEMSQVWLFVSGMSSDVTRQILKHLTNVITADTDELLQKYRQTLGGEDLIIYIQTFVTECISEGESNGHKYEKIPLNDVYIDQDTLRHVERMLLGNVWSGIKSVYIKTDDMTADQLALITGQLGQTKSLEKLYLDDEQSGIPSETLETVIDNCSDSLTCLNLQGVELEHGSVSAICRSISKCLMSLRLNEVELTHADIVELLHDLSQPSSIRQLNLSLDCTDHAYECTDHDDECTDHDDECTDHDDECTDHDYECTDHDDECTDHDDECTDHDDECTDHDDECRPRIDMSTMTQLQSLVLQYMCVDNLQTVTQCMEGGYLFCVTLSMTTLCEFVRNISQTKRHVEVELDRVTVREEESEDRVDLEEFLRECPGLTETDCEYDDSDKTWRIYFETDSKT